MNMLRTTSEKAVHEFVIVSVLSVCWYIDGYTPKIKFIKKMYCIIYKLELGQRNFLPLILWFTHETRKNWNQFIINHVSFDITPSPIPATVAVQYHKTTSNEPQTIQYNAEYNNNICSCFLCRTVVLPGDFAISSLEYVFAFWFWAFFVHMFIFIAYSVYVFIDGQSQTRREHKRQNTKRKKASKVYKILFQYL